MGFVIEMKAVRDWGAQAPGSPHFLEPLGRWCCCSTVQAGAPHRIFTGKENPAAHSSKGFIGETEDVSSFSM